MSRKASLGQVVFESSKARKTESVLETRKYGGPLCVYERACDESACVCSMYDPNERLVMKKKLVVSNNMNQEVSKSQIHTLKVNQ